MKLHVRFAITLLYIALPAAGATYYVDAAQGEDAASGSGSANAPIVFDGYDEDPRTRIELSGASEDAVLLFNVEHRDPQSRNHESHCTTVGSPRCPHPGR